MKTSLFLAVLLICSINSLLEAEDVKQEQYYPQLGLSFSLINGLENINGDGEHIGGGSAFFYSYSPRVIQDVGFSYNVTLSNSNAALRYRATVREFSYYTRIRLYWPMPLLSDSPKIWDPFLLFKLNIFSAFGIGGSSVVYDGKYVSETKKLFFLEFIPMRFLFIEPTIRYAPFENKWSFSANFSFDIFLKKGAVK
jgi:hypothetical protein